jgi:hypothetical protein
MNTPVKNSGVGAGAETGAGTGAEAGALLTLEPMLLQPIVAAKKITGIIDQTKLRLENIDLLCILSPPTLEFFFRT